MFQSQNTMIVIDRYHHKDISSQSQLQGPHNYLYMSKDWLATYQSYLNSKKISSLAKKANQAAPCFFILEIKLWYWRAAPQHNPSTLVAKCKQNRYLRKRKSKDQQIQHTSIYRDSKGGMFPYSRGPRHQLDGCNDGD